jgi:3-dehydroquinate dehydratase II
VFRQSNCRGRDRRLDPRGDRRGRAGIVINPAGLTFTSIPILDALKMFPGPIIELHISNIHRREEIYHRSLVSRVATAVIAGLGPRATASPSRALRLAEAAHA